MEPNDWRIVGWIWVILTTVVGIGIMLIPVGTPDGADPGLNAGDQGAALWWVGTAILFAAVIESWSSDRNRLLFTAGMCATIFGFLGASYTLYHGNLALLVLLGVGAFYSLILGFIAVFLFRAIYRPMAMLLRRSLLHQQIRGEDNDSET